MSTRLVLVLTALALVFVLVPTSPVAAKDDERTAFVLDAVKDLEMGEALRGDLVTLIPLVVPQKPTPTGVLGQLGAGLEFTEPDFASHKYAVNVKNPGDKPVLLLGGSILGGGERDRLLLYDTIVDAGAEVELHAWPASSTSEIRKEAIPFQLAESLAPTYIRRKANHGGNYNLVPTFISRNLDFRNEGDERKSLAAIGESKVLNDFTDQARQKLDAKIAETPQTGVVVGAIVAVRGRLQTLMVFGDRETIDGNKGSFLKGLTYTAAVIAIQSEKKNVPLPGKEDADKTFEIVKKEATELLERLKKAKVKLDRTQPDGAAGDRVLLQLTGGTRGRAVGLDGRLVHLEVFPHDPFSSALWGSAVELPDEDILSDPDRMGIAELGRYADQGRRMTYAEKRTLERLSPARGGGAGRGGMGGGGGRRR